MTISLHPCLSELLIFHIASFTDFILVYTEDNEKRTDPKHLEYREKFLANLRKSQLEMEEVNTDYIKHNDNHFEINEPARSSSSKDLILPLPSR